MTIIGMGFNNINVRRDEKVKGNLAVTHNVYVTDLEKEEMTAGGKGSQALKFSFEFVVKYGPEQETASQAQAGSITLGGYVLKLVTADQLNEAMQKWDKDKKVSKELTKEVLGHAFTRCNVECAVLSKEVNLPPPFPLPRLKTEKMGGEGDAQASSPTGEQ